MVVTRCSFSFRINKMLKVLWLGLVLIKIVALEATDNLEFAVVSTSQTPPFNQQQLNKQKEQVTEIKQELMSYLQIKNDEILKDIEKQQVNNNEKFNEISRQLEGMKQQIVEKSETLKDIGKQQVNNNEKFYEISGQLEGMKQQIAEKSEILKDIGKQQVNNNEKFNEISRQLEAMKQQIVEKSHLPRNCKEVQTRGNSVSGIYRIKPSLATDGFMVLCDMKTKGGGWTYFLNRFDGSQNFYLNWTDYKQGFGNLAGEFWLGLENLYLLTGYEPNELLIELVDWDLQKVSAFYSVFSIGSEKESYSLKLLGPYSGTAGDSFSPHVGRNFSTSDHDSTSGSCASSYSGAWWYTSCSFSDLSGKYQNRTVASKTDSIMYWGKFRGNKYSLKQARMMVKPRDNSSPPVLPHEVAD